MAIKGPLIRGRGERLVLFCALLLVWGIALLSYRGWNSLNEQNDEIASTQQVVDSSDEVLSVLKDAETGQRGFLLTGREVYLQPYVSALTDLPLRLEALTRAIGARADQRRRLERLRPLVQAKMDELRRTVELRRGGQADAALALVLTDRGNNLMAQVRQAGTEIRAAAYARLSEQSRKAQSSVNQIALVSTLGSLLLFLLLLTFSLSLQHGTRQREKLIASLRDSDRETREARDWLQTTLSSIGDAVIATDASGRVQFLNGVAEALTGWTQQNALGKSLDEIFVITSEETGQAVESPVTKVLREGGVAGLANHTYLTSRDGRRLSIDDSAAPIRDGSNLRGVVLVFRDISGRRAVERSDKEGSLALARLAAIIEHSEDAIISKDLNGIVTSWNRGAERIFGYTSEEMIGQPISTLASSHASDELASILKRIRSGEHIQHFETVRRTKAGREIYVSLAVSPIRDANGVIVGASKIARDISERVQIEKERHMQAQMVERMNADLQQFAYAASHDLREPLRTITAHGQLLQMRAGSKLDEASKASLGFIVSGSSRMSQLIDALLEYATAGAAAAYPVAEVQMAEVLGAALANLQRAIQDSGASITHDPLPAVLGDELHMVQLFQNLIGNALKYRSQRPLAIHISAALQGEDFVFSVSDNGQGVPAEYHEQIFQIFKRLHGHDYPGTGIGLATCKKIVERHGGRIWVESEMGNGSTFFFTVPAAKRPVENGRHG